MISAGRALILLASITLLSACVTAWSIIDKSNSHHQIGELSLQAPIGWNRFNQHDNKYVALARGNRRYISVERAIFTKQGLPMHGIQITKFSNRQAFPSINKSANKDLLTLELSQLYFAEQKIKYSADHLQLIETNPVDIAGYPGFRVHVRIQNDKGLFYDDLTYGIMIDDSFYTLSYYGPKLHYFETYLVNFKQLVASIKIAQ